MIYGYARVSTQDQHLNLQMDALNERKCEEIISEKLSAAKDRPALERVLSKLQAGDTLVVWKLDRLSRSVKHLCEVIDMLNEKGVAFESLSEKFDTSSSMGKLVLHVLGAVAEFERETIRERVRAGKKASKIKQGRKIKSGEISRATMYRRRKALLQDGGVVQ